MDDRGRACRLFRRISFGGNISAPSPVTGGSPKTGKTRLPTLFGASVSFLFEEEWAAWAWKAPVAKAFMASAATIRL